MRRAERVVHVKITERGERLGESRVVPFLTRPEAGVLDERDAAPGQAPGRGDRKSTRLNSSHSQISYAVFCLKKKKKGSPRASASAAQPHTHARRRSCLRGTYCRVS